MNQTIAELFRHKTWATLELIRICRELSDDKVNSSAPGTFGTIRETLIHTINSDGGYARQLLGDPEPPWSLDENRPLDWDEVTNIVQRSLPIWEELLKDEGRPSREVTSKDGYRFPGYVPIAQALHHGDVHRAHILTVLGSLGMEVPELDLWEYAESQGVLRAS